MGNLARSSQQQTITKNFVFGRNSHHVRLLTSIVNPDSIRLCQKGPRALWILLLFVGVIVFLMMGLLVDENTSNRNTHFCVNTQ